MSAEFDPASIDLSEVSPDEAELARICIAWARTGGTMFEGRLLEANVARVLGAEWPPTAISNWDLRFEGIRLQVRSRAEPGSFSLRGTDGVDVFVLVRKPDFPGDHDDLEYFVLPVDWVVRRGKKSITIRRLRQLGARGEIPESCHRDKLADRVRDASS